METEKTMETIAIRTEVIKLDALLKYTGAVASGGMAKELILAGYVKVNGEPCSVIRKQLHPGDTVSLDAPGLQEAWEITRE